MSKNFKDFGFKEPIQRALDDAGYDTPTPIQADAIPPLLQGSDLIGVAETGTGKTLAFLLPIFERLNLSPRPAAAADAADDGPDLEADNPQALVICPTRELAIQVAGESERFGRHLGVRTVLAYGGTSSASQKRELAAGCDIVVGTPGRLLDFLSSAWLSMRNLRFMVLDEADRMLDMGFVDDVDAILRRTPMSRQTILFSATVPEAVRELSLRYMFHPETVETHSGTRVTKNVDHSFYPVARSQKEELLLEILHREDPAKFLVFTATREATSEVGLLLRRHRYEVISLSSLLSQANRERALAAFRRGECQALVATDVAARGLDITDIDLVINFDAPTLAEDYVHRIGRTGRAERSGKAVTLITELDGRRVAEIERMLGEPVERVELEGFDYRTIPRGRDRGRGGGAGRGRSSGRGRRSGSGASGASGASGRRRGGGSHKPRRDAAAAAATARDGDDAATGDGASKPRRRRPRGRRGGRKRSSES
jgi:superfamily II DNA/RNA helicase